MARSFFLFSLFILICTSARLQVEDVVRQGKDYALFFAAEDYSLMGPLTNPIDNAEAIAAELEQSYDFTTEIVRNPSMEDIENKLAEYERKFSRGNFNQDGQLLIYFSGHGVEEGFFIPIGVDPARPYYGFSYSFWRDKIDQIPCKHIMVMIDACHSATFDPAFGTRTDRRFGRSGEREVDAVLERHRTLKSRKFITSDGVGEETPDRSTLAREFLRALRTHRSTGGYLSAGELHGSYLSRAAPRPGAGEFGSDEPASHFLFFRKFNERDFQNSQADLAAWQAAQQANNCAAYRTYLRNFPRGDFKELAQDEVDQCQQQEAELAAWNRAKRTNTPQAYRDFMRLYASSPYYAAAQRKLRDLSPGTSSGSMRSTSSFRPPDEMIFIQGGTFQMGDTFGDGEDDEKPVHSVTLDNYYLACTEVTNADFVQFLNEKGNQRQGGSEWYDISSPYSKIVDGNSSFKVWNEFDNHPVLRVSWYGAIQYCNWMSERHGLRPVYIISGSKITAIWINNGYRLPTEAEWEYAARSGGKNQKWAGTSQENQLGKYAKIHVNDNYFIETTPIGSFQENELGLFDLVGNAWEWCWDRYDSDYYASSIKGNPRGPTSGSRRVIRGGSLNHDPNYCRASDRNFVRPKGRLGIPVGFRLARSF